MFYFLLCLLFAGGRWTVSGWTSCPNEVIPDRSGSLPFFKLTKFTAFHGNTTVSTFLLLPVTEQNGISAEIIEIIPAGSVSRLHRKCYTKLLLLFVLAIKLNGVSCKNKGL